MAGEVSIAGLGSFCADEEIEGGTLLDEREDISI